MIAYDPASCGDDIKWAIGYEPGALHRWPVVIEDCACPLVHRRQVVVGYPYASDGPCGDPSSPVRTVYLDGDAGTDRLNDRRPIQCTGSADENDPVPTRQAARMEPPGVCALAKGMDRAAECTRGLGRPGVRRGAYET